MLFSILVVSLNPGIKLKETVESVLCQSFGDYEILIKDGLSTDGCLEQIPADDRIRILKQKDASIYDAMNQAVEAAKGEYFLFLNCGDLLYDEMVLHKVAAAVDGQGVDILYGDLERRDVPGRITAPSEITDFVCYRNIPCHQVCFYKRSMFAERAYDINYPVRADYEHFLYCKYKKNAKFYYLPEIISKYEGGGFSENKEQIKQSAKEHKAITKKYLGKKAGKYRLIMILTLQPLRAKIAGSKHFSKTYQKLKGTVQK